MLAVAVVVAALALAACGSDDKKSSTTTTTTAAVSPTTGGSQTPNTLSKGEVTAMQEMLDKVGCDVGPNDGILGPETLAALRAFQQGAGLTPDDIYGPATRTALEQASAAGRKVCSLPATTTTVRTGTTVKPAANAPCTDAAIVAGVQAADGLDATVTGFGCDGQWAYAFADISSLQYAVTVLLESENGKWVAVSRADNCSKVPASIRAAACGTN